MKWTAALVVDTLREAYGLHSDLLEQEEWSMVTEVPLRTPKLDEQGRPRKGYWGLNKRRIDVFMVRNWAAGKGHERVAIEVKVSRSDYKNETPEKRAPAEAAAHRTVYAAPAGLIDPRTLPDGWGLIEVYDTRAAALLGAGQPVGDAVRSRARWRIKAVQREPYADLDYLVAAGFRRAFRVEESLRRGAAAGSEVARLRDEVERLATALQRRDAALTRTKNRLRLARSMALAMEGAQECGDCGHKVILTVDCLWEHADDADRRIERACYERRAERSRRGREGATGARYLSGYAGPVVPKVLLEALNDVYAHG